MELDQRVKALEYEIKILKNEIQKTLLEIHEQVLNHYYPSLRSEDPVAPPAEPPTVVQVERRKPVDVSVIDVPSTPAPQARLQPPPQARLEPPPQARLESPPQAELEPPAAGAEPLPIVRQVTLNEIRAAQESLTAEAARAATTGKMIEWALNGGAKIGNTRMQTIIQVFKAKGFIDAEASEVLLQVTPLNRRHPTEEAGMMDIMRIILSLNALLNRDANVEETFALMKEANLG